MVNMSAPSTTPEGTSGSCDADALAEMRAAMEELHCHNHMLEDDVHIIMHLEQDSNPT